MRGWHNFLIVTLYCSWKYWANDMGRSVTAWWNVELGFMPQANFVRRCMRLLCLPLCYFIERTGKTTHSVRMVCPVKVWSTFTLISFTDTHLLSFQLKNGAFITELAIRRKYLIQHTLRTQHLKLFSTHSKKLSSYRRIAVSYPGQTSTPYRSTVLYRWNHKSMVVWLRKLDEVSSNYRK